MRDVVSMFVEKIQREMIFLHTMSKNISCDSIQKDAQLFKVHIEIKKYVQ